MRTLMYLLALLSTSSVAAAPFEHDGVRIGTLQSSLAKGQYKCSPSFLPKQTICTKIKPGNIFGVSAIKVELGFKDAKCYMLFISFSPNSTPIIGKAIEARYGKITKATHIANGVDQAIWSQGSTDLLLNRDDNRNSADVTIVRY